MLWFGVVIYAYCTFSAAEGGECAGEVRKSVVGMETEEACLATARETAAFALSGIPNVSYSVRCEQREAQG